MFLLVHVWPIGRRSRDYLLVAATVLCLGACGSTSATSTGPSPIKCLVTLTGPDSSLAPSASAATITISTTPECAWTALADASWVARLDPSSGQGSGTVQVAVAANPSAVARQTDIVVNGARARIQQEPAPCTYVLSASSATVDASGGSHQVNVSTSAGCAWTAASATTWISMAVGSSGVGSGAVEFRVQASDGSTRTGNVTIAGQSFTFTQNGADVSGAGGSAPAPGCMYILNSLTQIVPAAGGGGSLSLKTPCAWSAAASASWITIQSPTVGTGSATVVFSVATNSGAARHGTITIGSAAVSVDQAAAPNCAFTVNPLTAPVASAATSSQSLTVTTTTGCTWTSSSNASWITVTTGAGGSASGTVKFDVGANAGAARSGTLTVAGQTVTVSQVSSCSYALNSTTLSIGPTGGSGPSVTVSAAPGCPWTTVSGTPWLTITSGASGSGNGTVHFTAAQNTGVSRSGSLSIAGQTVTVNQGSGCVYAVTVVPTSFKDEGGSALGTVTTALGCPWTSSSGSKWIVVQSGATESGPGTVTLQIQPNPGGSRTGKATIAGDSLDIKQSKN
jgi:hypothetical protein